MRVKWKLYRFECPVETCKNGRTEADHHRRDPDTMDPGACVAHGNLMEFVGTTDLVELPTSSKTREEALDSAQEAMAMLGCPYHVKSMGGPLREGRHGPGTCDQGCYQEPRCSVDAGRGGWEQQLLEAALDLVRHAD